MISGSTPLSPISQFLLPITRFLLGSDSRPDLVRLLSPILWLAAFSGLFSLDRVWLVGRDFRARLKGD